MEKGRGYEVEAEVVGVSRGKSIIVSFEIFATSFDEAAKKAEYAAIEEFYNNGGHGDDPQIEKLIIDGEVVD